MSERDLQSAIRAGLKQRGYTVYVVPMMKMTAAGLPDLIFWSPQRPGVLYVWELKRERRGVISPEQAAFIAHLATVPGIDARIVTPSDWELLKEIL